MDTIILFLWRCFSDGVMMKIMGIINVTPDSFYDGGRYFDRDRAVEHGLRLVRDGADMLDIGGESTRPGSVPVSAQEEMDRVCPVIEALAGRVAVPLSVDTTKSAVAAEALRCGASIINDISGCSFDPAMTAVAARYGAGLVIMHIQGRPQTMQVDPRYDDVVQEIYAWLKESVAHAVADGVSPDKIIIDPGIGFGKTLEQNYAILNNLECFLSMGFPCLSAFRANRSSRSSMPVRPTPCPPP